MAAIPGYPEQDIVELATDIWPTVRSALHSVMIVLISDMHPGPSPGNASDSGPPTPTKELTSPLSPTIYTPSVSAQSSIHHPQPTSPPSRHPSMGGSRSATLHITFALVFESVSPFDVREIGLLQKRVSQLREIIESRTGLSDIRLSARRSALRSDQTLADCGLVSGDTIVVTPNPNMRARKPVIYLLPPSALPDVSVNLSLIPSWTFSAIYPPVETLKATMSNTHRPGQSIVWTVSADPDGTLVDKTTGLEVSYLFWEASPTSSLPTPEASRAASPVEETGLVTFDPAHPTVSPEESILLPAGDVPAYLDAALKALALHTEARTSFITYWLPDLLRHEHIALRFVAQESYERAAPLAVSPAPDVVTRVFMLFRGVPADELGLWDAARARAAEDAALWAGVVGIDAARASDPALFRVLEWGGMEVR
ncbi:hypothetical protein BC834DRAFT_877926 [Gloeopeniophorella convolvens]|nr:hypothetical protein BC834DRAFT_877926 [Gloeopeniophorella convolvens]